MLSLTIRLLHQLNVEHLCDEDGNHEQPPKKKAGTFYGDTKAVMWDQFALHRNNNTVRGSRLFLFCRLHTDHNDVQKNSETYSLQSTFVG